MITKRLKFAKKLKVLYIEDNSDARESTLGLLENIFDNVSTAINGEDGLEKFKEGKFDLILTDINMPKMNGLEMINEIRKRDKDIPIIVISAYNESGYFIETIKMGVEGYLLKPINLKQFINMLQKSVEKIELRYELLEYQNNLEKKVQEQTKTLYKQLYYDDLTKLGNRNSLLKYIEEKEPYSLMLIDIKNFSVINDLYGTKTGDEVLVQIATLLRSIAQEKYEVFRVNSDCFALLGSFGIYKFDEPIIQEIVAKVQNITLNTKTNDIEINVLTTVSVASDCARDKLLKNAEIALHYAKRKNHYFVQYGDILDLDKHFKKELDAILMVKNALKEDRIIPYYQKIEKNEENATYECLVRIKQDDKIISPSEFLESVKKTIYYAQLTKRMIDKSFGKFQGTKINFSINLSYEDILNQDTLEYLEQKIKDNSISKQLIIEIIESENIEDFNFMKKFLIRMSDLGVRIAIDDFGSGYSNFFHILELNPDIIKIDGSLIKNICSDSKSFLIVKTIVNFANELGIDIVAEYVHDKETFEKVGQLNIAGLQGYYISQPQADI
ncbi:EAL domain-containing response regulator [Sulfurimonas sp.]